MYKFQSIIHKNSLILYSGQAMLLAIVNFN